MITLRFIVFVMLVLLTGVLPGFVRAQASASVPPYVVSERVGPVIDAEERAYFGLFPRIEGFVAARPYPPTTQAFPIVVERTGRPDTTLRVDPEVADVLSMYLDEFEYVYRDAGAVDWPYLYQVAWVKQPFEPGGQLTITRTDGTVVEGRLIRIDDEGLLVTTAKQVSAMLRDAEAAVWMPAGAVREIRGQQSWLGRMFRTLWLMEAGRHAMYEPHVVPRLERREMLPEVLSPELRAVRARGAVTPPYHGSESIGQVYRARMATQLHLTAMVQPFPPAVHVRPPPSATSDGAAATIRYRNPMQYWGAAYGVHVDYDLTTNLRVGAEYDWRRSFSRSPLVEGQWSSEVSDMEGSFLTGWVKVGLKRARPEAFAYKASPNGWDMLAIWGGAGVSVGWFENQYPALIAHQEIFRDKLVRVGGNVALDAEYYFTHRLSVVSGIRGAFFPHVPFPFAEVTYEQDDSSDYTWHQKAYRATLWMMNFKAGLRVHLGL